MIKEAYCSKEVSILLKEKGFNEKCRGGYHYEFDDNDSPIVMLEEWTARPYNNDFVDEGFLCSAPTHQMAMKWLRKVHNIIIEPESVWNGKEWEYLLFVVTPQNADSPYYEHNPYKSYEECVETALKYVLENLI